ncbi:hypothetical protein V1511DRAFT_512694 [Dipodascopsis uninucleata]
MAENTVSPVNDSLPVSSSSSKKRKRDKYVAVACTECQRRKVKCNGLNKCVRCSRMNLHCIYDTDSRKKSKNPEPHPLGWTDINTQAFGTDNTVNSTTEASSSGKPTIHKSLVNNLLNSAENSPSAKEPMMVKISSPSSFSPSSSVSYTPRSILSPSGATNSIVSDGNGGAKGTGEYNGFTSSSYPFKEANVISNRMDNDECSNSDEDEAEGPISLHSSESISEEGAKPKFLLLEYEDAKHLMEVYEAEINSMYPIFEVGELGKLYEDSFRIFSETGSIDTIATNDIDVLKILLAIATCIVESHIDEGKQMYEEVLKTMDRKTVAAKASMSTLVSLWLIHQYQFHSDMESLACRTISFAAVMALELGLHLSETLDEMFTNEVEREQCRVLFWSLYIVDRRMSISVGRPYIFHDEDIDQKMPKYINIGGELGEESRYRYMYLNSMIDYSRIVGKVWYVLSNFKPGKDISINIADIDYIEYLIGQWQNSLSLEMRLPPPNSSYIPPQATPPLHSRKLQTILYLRRNLMYLHILRPILFSSRTIADNMPYAMRAVDVALDSIKELSRLHFETDLYKSCQIHYNYFLVSALGVLFSAIIHAPAIFSAKCKAEFNTALYLIKLLSKFSRIGWRLWTSVKRIRNVVDSVGASSQGGPLLKTSYVNNNDNIVPESSHRVSVSSMSDNIAFSADTNRTPDATEKPSCTALLSADVKPERHINLDRPDEQPPGGDKNGSIDAAQLSTEISQLLYLMVGEKETPTVLRNPISDNNNMSNNSNGHSYVPNQNYVEPYGKSRPTNNYGIEKKLRMNIMPEPLGPLLHNRHGVKNAYGPENQVRDCRGTQVQAGTVTPSVDTELFKLLESLF